MALTRDQQLILQEQALKELEQNTDSYTAYLVGLAESTETQVKADLRIFAGQRKAEEQAALVAHDGANHNSRVARVAFYEDND